MTVVAIVDDHHLIRTGVKNLLESAFDDLHVKEAATIAQALDLLNTGGTIDLILLDIGLPDSAALDGLKRLKKCAPSTAVALISGTEDNQMIQSALALGADGFVPKSADPNILVNAVSLILGGEIFLPRSFLISGAEGAPLPPVKPKYVLTARQQEVFGLICKGQSNKEIARHLDVSESTIKTHVSAILKIIGTNSRTKAIALFQDETKVL